MLNQMKRWIAAGVAFIQIVTWTPAAFASGVQDAGDIPVDSSHFPDESFRSWILNPGNLNGAGSDAVLTAEERSAVTEINVSGQNIADLTGIGHFSSLLVLNCSKNSLTSLDLSQSALLEELSCSSNRLTALDLSSNLNLKSVYCASNLLTSLNVTGCARLQSLNCEKNYLTSLDLSGNPELIQLYSRHNQLTQLDVSRNTKLKFIETFDNQLTSFDCTMLPDLEFLHIDYNKLTTLDMSQNPKLQGNGFVAANNQLDELTLPNLPGMSIEASVFYEQNPRTGYDTVRWFYDFSYSQEIAEGDRVEANGRKVYAKWIANPYTVYYNANGGHGSIPPQAVEYDQTFRLSPNTFTRIGYTFLNWNTYPDAVGGKTFTDGQEVVNLAGTSSNRDRVTLYAQWSANAYTIRYDANGGQGRVDDTPAVYDQPAVLAGNQFTRQDAVFSGWSLTAGEGNPKDYAPGDSVRNLTAENQGAVTLYAVWRSHAEIQQQYQDQLTDFFRAFQTNSYYPEDWASLQSIRRVASETVAQSGGDESAMQTALEAAYEEARNVSTKEQRAQAVAQSWRTAHSGILSQISVPVALDRLEETSLLAQAAVADAGTEWLAQQSTLTDPASRQDAARAAQNKLATEVQQLQSMQHAIVWLGSVKDAYQVPLSSVTSADAAQYAASVNAYAALSSQEKAYCTPGVADQLTVRRNLAQEKQIAAETKTAIESADTAGAADRLFLEGVDRFKEVGTIVRQKTPVIEVKPTASAITKGQKLSDSQLIGGKADAEGTFAWKDGSVAPPQTGAYPVVFTPKDGTAYRTVEFYISVTVNEPVPEVPSSSGTPAVPAPGSSPAQPSSPAPGGTASSSAPVSSKPQSGSSSISVSQSVSSSSASAAESGTAAESGSVSSSGSSSDAQEPAVPKTPAGLILAVVAAVGAAAAAVFLILSKKRK